jgi:membrane associated rhomboid family serine protease
VAYWAHIVGFGAGIVLIFPFLIGRRAPARQTVDG